MTPELALGAFFRRQVFRLHLERGDRRRAGGCSEVWCFSSLERECSTGEGPSFLVLCFADKVLVPEVLFWGFPISSW